VSSGKIGRVSGPKVGRATGALAARMGSELREGRIVRFLPYHGVPAVYGRSSVQFVLGVLVFVVVIGLIDAKLPWPAPRSKDRAP
jgi:hypothetical protein